MQNVTLSTVETALCKGLQQILLEYDDGSPLSNAVLQRLELRCIEHIHVAFSLGWASMDRDLNALRTGRLGRNYREASDPRMVHTTDHATQPLLGQQQQPGLQNRDGDTQQPIVPPESALSTTGPQAKETPIHSIGEGSLINNKGKECAEEQSTNINNISSNSKGCEDMDWDPGCIKAGRADDNERKPANTTSSGGSTHRERMPRKNISYRKGLYAEVVGLRGPLPTCQTCREKIARGQKRFILHRTIGHNHGIITFYHFKKTCIDGASLSTIEQEIANAELAVKKARTRDHMSSLMPPIKNE